MGYEIETPLKGKVNYEILRSILGQLSDGKWENCRAMEKYWENLSIRLGGGDEVIIEVMNDWIFRHRPSGTLYSAEEVMAWFARKIRAVVKDFEEWAREDPKEWYAGTEWKRTCGVPACGFGYSTNPTVGDCYRAYDALMGRDTGKYEYALSE